MASAAKHAAAPTEELDTRVCEYTLRKVFSWLDVPDLVGSAALVSKRWAQASSCKEVWRRRMHARVLDSLFSRRQQHDDQAAAPADGLAAAVAAVAAAGLTPTRLFAGLYAGSLLANGSFLERLNAAPKGAAAAADGRRLVWEPTFNTRGMTWAHPFDFFPELCELPEGEHGLPASPKPFSVGCLATSSGAWSEITQVVDLRACLTGRGMPGDTAAWLLSGAGLPLEFSVFVAGGAMAGGEYQAVLLLVTEADAAAAAERGVALASLPKMTLPFGHPPAGSPGIEAVSAANLRSLGLTAGSRSLARAPLQPAPGVWSRYHCRVALPRGGASPVSHVVVALRGRASRNSRLGHYASKFAAAQLRFVPADEAGRRREE